MEEIGRRNRRCANGRPLVGHKPAQTPTVSIAFCKSKIGLATGRFHHGGERVDVIGWDHVEFVSSGIDGSNWVCVGWMFGGGG